MRLKNEKRGRGEHAQHHKNKRICATRPYADDVRDHPQHLRLHARARLVCRRGGARSAGLSALGAGGEQPNMLEVVTLTETLSRSR